MTREEAIRQIENRWGIIDYGESDALGEALDMAIEALSEWIIPKVSAEQENEPKFYDEDDYWNGRVPTHGRLIDADALSLEAIRWRLCLGLDCSLCPIYRNGVCGVWEMINDAPTVQADRPNGTGYVGVKDDYPVSVKEVLNITAETGALETQRRIKELQPIDRPHGEWVEREDWNGDSYYDCSVCGESFVLFDGNPSMNLYHFCPNCGARMNKGGDDTTGESL